MTVTVKNPLAGSPGGNQAPFEINDEKFRVIHGSTAYVPEQPERSHFIVAQDWRDPDPDQDATQKVRFAVQWLNDLLGAGRLHFDVEVDTIDASSPGESHKYPQLRVQCYRRLGEAP